MAAPGRAQESREERAAGYLERGDRLFKREAYQEALAPYRQAEALLDGDPVILKRIGITLARTGEYARAVDYLEPLQAAGDTAGLYVTYYLGVARQELGQYEPALAMYRSCLEQVGGEAEPDELEELEERIAYTGFMKELAETPLEVRMDRVDSAVNSAYADYGARPMKQDSVLFFTSQRPAAGFPGDLVGGRNEDIYFSRREGDHWQPAEPLDRFNTRGDEALLAVSPVGRTLYLYSDVNQGDIMQVEADAPLADPVPLPGQVNSPFHESSAALADSGRILYFTSDREDLTHYGGLDIYRATRDASGRWQEVENLGPDINSPRDENYVYYSESDSALYFSSDRRMTVGGYDVMVSRRDGSGKLSPPQNLGLPVNTPAHDIFFYKEGDRAWYATAGDKGREDIYEMEFITPEYHEGWFRETVTGTRKIGSWETIGTLWFDYRATEPRVTDPAWNHLVDVLTRAEGAVVKLTGHTDWLGNERENALLSFERAANVAAKLMERGVNPGQLIVEARGEYEVCTDTVFDDAAERARALGYNRRVEFTVEEQGEPYIHVKQGQLPGESGNESTAVSPGRYAVMVYVSGTRHSELSENPHTRESFSDSDQLYYYHSKYYRSVHEADSMLNHFKETHPHAYLFTLEDPSPR